MDTGISGRCFFQREEGAWHVTIEGPAWVISEMAAEIYEHGVWLHNWGGECGADVMTAMLGARMDMRASCALVTKHQDPVPSMNDRPDADWGIPADMDEHDRAIWLRRCKALNMTHQEWRDFERPHLMEYIQQHPALVEFLTEKIIKEYGLNRG